MGKKATNITRKTPAKNPQSPAKSVKLPQILKSHTGGFLEREMIQCFQKNFYWIPSILTLELQIHNMKGSVCYYQHVECSCCLFRGRNMSRSSVAMSCATLDQGLRATAPQKEPDSLDEQIKASRKQNVVTEMVELDLSIPLFVIFSSFWLQSPGLLSGCKWGSGQAAVWTRSSSWWLTWVRSTCAGSI